jgi:hypothetical protein
VRASGDAGRSPSISSSAVTPGAPPGWPSRLSYDSFERATPKVLVEGLQRMLYSGSSRSRRPAVDPKVWLFEGYGPTARVCRHTSSRSGSTIPGDLELITPGGVMRLYCRIWTSCCCGRHGTPIHTGNGYAERLNRVSSPLTTTKLERMH